MLGSKSLSWQNPGLVPPVYTSFIFIWCVRWQLQVNFTMMHTLGMVQDSMRLGSLFLSMRWTWSLQWAFVSWMYDGLTKIYSVYITELLLWWNEIIYGREC